jgi:hypothetical protein
MLVYQRVNPLFSEKNSSNPRKKNIKKKHEKPMKS